MTKNALTAAVDRAKSETHDALQIVYDSLNKGQQQKIIKNEKVAELFKRYGVEV